MSRTKKRILWKDRATSARLIRNIITVYHSATQEERAEGLLWYQTAHNDAVSLASKHSISVSQAVGVIAALSPGRDWGLNLQDADRLIDAFINARPIPSVGTYGRKNINKALNILRGENPLDVLPLTGPKVRAFFALILSPSTDYCVCVDRHAKAIALGRVPASERDNVVKPAQYDWYAQHYLIAAERLGMLAHQVQAITWVAWRRAKASDEIPF